MTTSPTSTRNRQLPPSLVANLQNDLAGRKPPGGDGVEGDSAAAPVEAAADSDPAVDGPRRPVVLVTNADGISSPGLTHLVEALVRIGQYDVYVCAPESDMSASAHSVTIHRTLAATSAPIEGAKGIESGHPADCISLALSGALFSWSNPALFYSGAVAGAREAIMIGVPFVAMLTHRSDLCLQKEESRESDFKDAVEVCLPLIKAAMRDIEKGLFPRKCLLNIEIPTARSKNKGFKLTKHSFWRSIRSWQAVSRNRYPAGHFMSMNQGLGAQLAQLNRDASAAGAARRSGGQSKMLETESVAAAGKPDQREVVKKLFRLELRILLEMQQEDPDEDLDFRALKNGYIAVTPLHLDMHVESQIRASVSDWLSAALEGCRDAS
ncbi:unnamed protein product [Musa acuminata subsp. malaccensis]|uniref:(wild Malaysian banana) hypothetical protein n=1 Tax=Musa acuminata subsp. malaccensis TaxID=214687 RepID=A0A804IQ59_MUSAM|nr:PREDICTED: uncharacterized protein LOC103973885 [Musa acuminata subsp. malaccensis]CAG1842317.1 unnamed protein product [Musa acuminata subsp. malaccensis]